MAKEEISSIQNKEVEITIRQGLYTSFSTEWLFALDDDLTGLIFKAQLINKNSQIVFYEFILGGNLDGNLIVNQTNTTENKVIEVDCILKTIKAKTLKPTNVYLLIVQMISGFEVLQDFVAEVFVRENSFINA